MIQNEYVTRLPDFELFKGDTILLPLSFMRNSAEYLDITGCEVRFYLFPYGMYTMPVMFDDKDYKVAVMGNAVNGECFISLESRHTRDLEYNKYSYQPILLFKADMNRQFTRGQGDIIFKDSYN